MSPHHRHKVGRSGRTQFVEVRTAHDQEVASDGLEVCASLKYSAHPIYSKTGCTLRKLHLRHKSSAFRHKKTIFIASQCALANRDDVIRALRNIHKNNAIFAVDDTNRYAGGGALR